MCRKLVTFGFVAVCKPAVAEKANGLLLVHMSPESGGRPV